MGISFFRKMWGLVYQEPSKEGDNPVRLTSYTTVKESQPELLPNPSTYENSKSLYSRHHSTSLLEASSMPLPSVLPCSGRENPPPILQASTVPQVSLGHLTRGELAAFTTFRAWKKQLRRKKSSATPYVNGDVRPVPSALNILFHSALVGPAASSGVANMLLCVWDMRKDWWEKQSYENSLDDQKDASEEHDSFLQHLRGDPFCTASVVVSGEKVALWLFHHLPRLFASRTQPQGSVLEESINGAVQCTSSSNFSCLLLASLFSHSHLSIDASVTCTEGVVAPVLLELVRFFIRLGILQSPMNSGKAAVTSGSITESPNDAVEHWLCFVLLSLLRLLGVLPRAGGNVDQETYEMRDPNLSVSPNQPELCGLHRENWLWILLTEWVAVICVLQKEFSEEGSDDKGQRVLSAVPAHRNGLPINVPISASTLTSQLQFFTSLVVVYVLKVVYLHHHPHLVHPIDDSGEIFSSTDPHLSEGDPLSVSRLSCFFSPHYVLLLLAFLVERHPEYHSAFSPSTLVELSSEVSPSVEKDQGHQLQTGAKRLREGSCTSASSAPEVWRSIIQYQLRRASAASMFVKSSFGDGEGDGDKVGKNHMLSTYSEDLKHLEVLYGPNPVEDDPQSQLLSEAVIAGW